MQAKQISLGPAPWGTILVLVGAGVISAVQVGKATVALATVQGDLHLSLAVASWLLSAFALVGALAGAPIGLAADRIGAKRMLVSGLVAQGLASLVGAAASGPSLLLAARALEGLGFLCVVVAAPVLIVRIAVDAARERAIAIWATFMPLGITLSLLAAPVLGATGWRGFWLVNAILLLIYAGLVAIVVPGVHIEAVARRISADMRDALAAVGPWLLAALFAIFNAVYFAVFGFLPVILTDRLAVSAETASMLTALAVMVSAVGNLACGVVLSKGARPWLVLIVCFAGLGATALGVFSDAVPAVVGYGLSVLFAFVAGFIPVVVMGSVPQQAPRPELVGATMGFVMQGNNVGMTIGPAATGLIAGAFGWSAMALVVAGLALIAAGLTLCLRARDMPARGRAPLAAAKPC